MEGEWNGGDSGIEEIAVVHACVYTDPEEY